MPDRAQTELDVLLADPDDGRRAAVEAILREVGWNVTLCRTTDEAVAACRAQPPTVLVVDADACRHGDTSVIEAIKGDPDLFPIGVVLRSRELGVDDALDILSRGAQVLVDPVPDAELVAAVRSAAHVTALQEELRSRAAAL